MSENFLSINLPLVKTLEQFDKRTKLCILSSNYPLDGISLEVLQQDNSRTKQTIHTDQFYQTALLTMHKGHQSLTLSEESLAQLEQEEHFRFRARITKEKAQKIRYDIHKLDETFRNALEIEGLQVKLIYFDSRSQDHQIRVIHAPSYIPDIDNDELLTWDICMFQDSTVLETNAFTKTP